MTINSKESSTSEQGQNTRSSETSSLQASSKNIISKIIKIISTLIWTVVIAVICLQIFAGNTLTTLKNQDAVSFTIPNTQKNKIPSELESKLDQALTSAKHSAYQNMASWEKDINQRIDHPFLDWYYGYFTQLDLGSEAIVQKLLNGDEVAEEKYLSNINKQFAKQVFQPARMQLEIERFTREAIDTYISEASETIAGLSAKYNIPKPTWNLYLDGLTQETTSSSMSEEQDLKKRLLSDGTVYLGLKASIPIAAKISSKLSATAIEKIATKAAVSAVGSVGSIGGVLVGAQLINPLAGVGLIAWDVWSHNKTAEEERPLMKENLEKYISEIKNSLLNDRQIGIIPTLENFHYSIINSMT